MSNDQETVKETNEEVTSTNLVQQELVTLKQRANMIGLKFHPNIGLAKLKEKVNDQLKKDEKQIADEAEALTAEAKKAVEPIPVSIQGDFTAPKQFGGARQETPIERKMRVRKQATKLVRFRLTCMNENKKKWPGEMISVSNSLVGTIKRFIPFNADAWHCESMLLNVLQDRKFVSFYEVKDRKGRVMKKSKLAKEFAIEILPALSPNELKKLAAKQAAAKRPEDD